MQLRTLVQSLLLVAGSGLACGPVPIDDERNDRRLFPARGVIRGTVTYVGPRPCSRDGHIVGNAVLLVFDRRNPPPPDGVATSPVNFVAVPGDVLFRNEPRSVGTELFCPPASPAVTASASFTLAPLDGGSYQIRAFYDRRGRFWPTFKFRNQPEAGDLGGGYVDLQHAQTHAGDPSYRPIFLPVDVGVAQGGAAPDEIPDYRIGPNGFVADNVPVLIGTTVPFTRPYFHPAGAEQIGDARSSDANPTGNPLAVPIVVMPQDVKVLAPPSNPTAETLDAYQASFRSLELRWGVAPDEVDPATDPAHPFGLQLPPLPPRGKGGLLVFARDGSIPESAAVPELWPQIALVKLADDPLRVGDPQSLVIQGTPEETVVTGKPPGPLVVLQGITLLDGSLARTIAGPVPVSPTTAALRGQVTALLRPAVLCFDPRRVDVGGLLVTPHLTGRSADATETGEKPLFDARAIAQRRIVRETRRGCLPTGRYAISLVYPTGQAWTVPNEMGGCARSEGSVFVGGATASCSAKPRPVLLSQGARAVLEIVSPQGEEGLRTCEDHPVPTECMSL
jgi:hypothetical protein